MQRAIHVIFDMIQHSLLKFTAGKTEAQEVPGHVVLTALIIALDPAGAFTSCIGGHCRFAMGL